VDNITNAYVGAAMAECALPRGSSSRTRVACLCTGIVAANAPDVDLLYSTIIEEPLGYLLHHRGHSHTWPGLAALGLLIWAGLRLLPSTRASIRDIRSRWVLLVAAALGSHLLMDAANSYGTHLFYPFSSRWIYGDAVFVLEPWLWAILGATVALNAAGVWRLLTGCLTILPIGALTAIGLFPRGMLAVLVAVVGTAAFATRGWDRRRRSVAALAATAAIFVAMPGVSRAAKAEARRALGSPGEGAVVDIVADANPGVPWCWSVMTLQWAADGLGETLVARRATLSLLPGVWPAASCASARLSRSWAGEAESPSIVWHRRWRIDVDELRALSAANCRVRAWLQFGRVPQVANGRIADVRFEHPIGQNFTPMAIAAGSSCPAYLTRWELPRRDVLDDASGRP
jgi:inner membrane protein